MPSMTIRGGAKRDLVVLAAASQPRELARVRLGAAVYGTPVGANGTLFVASQKYLWAVERGATLAVK